MAKLSIAYKGSLLIFGLIAVELVIIAALISQLDKAERDAEREARVKDIYVHTQAVARGLYTGHEKIVAWHNSLSSASEMALRQALDDVLSNIQFLRTHQASVEQISTFIELEKADKALTERILEWIERIK